MRKELTLTIGICNYVQEKSSSREIEKLQEQLQSSESKVTDLKKTLERGDSAVMSTKVSHQPLSFHI